jgi:DNA-binding transcriptional MerR regulator
MSMMTVEQVAEFLGVQNVRVERLERESLLLAAEKDANGSPLFEKEGVEKYKVLAERLGGL